MKYPQLVSMPSAVSDWLEEQLEARGIDAVVYTRYVLSLLHSHAVDVAHPDDDLQFSRLKEVRRSSGGRKRFRRSSSDWWRHAQVDAEQIKRSAAVECLMSASDQNCEIESLVDELCEKLKEVESAPASPVTPVDAHAEAPNEKITPLELAEKYYAAFPPLGPRTPAADRKAVSLTPKWKPASASPIKKKAVRKQGSRQTSYDQKLHAKVDGETMKPRSQNKQRFPYFNRTKNAATRKPETFTCWDFSMFSNKKSSVPKQKTLDEVSETFDQCIEVNRAVWTNDEDMNMYEDLPVDIQELLDSPSPHDDTVEMMNMANMRDDGKREFIPCGTNIISSIWSTDQDISYDNTFNSAVDRRSDNDSALDFKFSSISIDNQINAAEDWPIFNSMSENETNNLFENNRVKKSSFLGGFRSLPGDWSKLEGGEKDECFENEKTLNHLAISLMKLNHNKEKSCFKEIMPRSQFASHGHPFNPFGRTTSMFGFNSRHGIGIDREKEDLLTSERSHFKPIAQKVDLRPQGHYADGATFVISSSLEKVEYKRSESGTMLLETEYGQNKKYYEYKVEDDATATTSSELEFVLKFSICQNDKACQTEEQSEMNFVLGKVKNDSDDERYSPKKPSCVDEYGEETRCACPGGKVSALKKDDFSIITCPVHRSRPESTLAEILWKYEVKTCEKCNNNNMTWSGNWSSEGQMDPDWESQGLRNIWSGDGEVCHSCSSLNGGNACRPPPSLQLREDISQDGEQLLSDLSVLQKTYMEDLPSSEISCDISELVSGTKRRHSFTVEDMDVHNRSSWSFASRLEEDCLIQMSTLPTLRSVTL